MIIKTKQVGKNNKITIEYEEGEDVVNATKEAIKMLSNMLEYHSALVSMELEHLDDSEK